MRQPIIDKLITQKEALLKKKGLNPALDTKIDFSISQLDSRIGNLENAKKQTFGIVGASLAETDKGLEANKAGNAMGSKIAEGLTLNAIDRMGGSDGERLAAIQKVRNDSFLKDQAAEEGAAKVRSAIYQSSFSVPSSFETIKNNNEYQTGTINNQKDQNALAYDTADRNKKMQYSHLTPKVKAILDSIM